ncbi:peptide-N(4)-(N-acetyl-beta-glucosaminyl)asparagine amidase isoform X2 [Coccinella septempunctata]|uniref:peptide-N(4)-(N-acetyl-beta- glucosaminyl)asparagine amidase isoform X2 n=1 Tax=Coccinella septempunctata TaxID=41139 RepID=UPI001D05D053|nr:peptide-N(4)-(N-acetyl-beta-glucosaminyl)asparagine amidase isoform X2 [Coccinella septempunctata]
MSHLGDRFLPQPVCLEPVVHKFSNPFLRKIEDQFHHALAYEHKDTLENARKIIPSTTLVQRMLKKYRNMQMAAKKERKICSVDTDDLILVELLNWFKEEFFEWVDSPDCDYCRNKTVFSHVKNNPSERYAKRVEIFKCDVCKRETPFPRYNDVNILLETRKGRCGEWANAFTLLCRALDFDARLVVDETDHVWTEVYSRHQKRWLHCDPCENVCDSPLMYEHGWKKRLSYVIAYSPLEVQDVTWRYTSNYREVLKRRTSCAEWELIRAIVELRNERLSKCSKAKREFVQRRILMELADFLTERQPGDEMYGGRTSGSLDWRKARGDISDSDWPKSSFCFKLTFPQLSKMEYSMKYTCSSDRYVYGSDLKLSQWDQATYSQVDMMRKEEKDWNKVYLCRKEGTERGSIVWMFRLLDTTIKINSVYIKFQRQTFENGNVAVRIASNSSDNQEKVGIDFGPGNEMRSLMFQGCDNIRIEATLSGGKGSTAWQHAQLFRQDWKTDTVQYPFEVFLTFVN